MNYELTGSVTRIYDVWESETSDFCKREFVVTIDESSKYPQPIKLACIKDKVALLDPVNEGDVVTVAFNLRGREYNERYYVDLEAWKLSVDLEAGVVQPPADAPDPGAGARANPAPAATADDELIDYDDPPF